MMEEIVYKISIIISVFNGENTLDECFESVKNQTFQDFEIICINDASTDNTLEKLKKWQEIIGLERFIIINNPQNLGLTKSLNLALAKAQGKYIARIDADDIWRKDKLEKQYDFLENNFEYGIVGSNHINIFEKKRKTVELPEKHELIKKKLFERNPFAHSCILARTDLIKSLGGYDENIKFGQDYDLWLRCFPQTKFYNIQKYLCSRTIDSNSLEKQNQQMTQSIRTRLKYIKKYRYSWNNYLYLIEPLIVILTPNFIKNLKRKYF